MHVTAVDVSWPQKKAVSLAGDSCSNWNNLVLLAYTLQADRTALQMIVGDRDLRWLTDRPTLLHHLKQVASGSPRECQHLVTS